MFDICVNIDGLIDGFIKLMISNVTIGVRIIAGMYIGDISVMLGVIATKYANIIRVPLM